MATLIDDVVRVKGAIREFGRPARRGLADYKAVLFDIDGTLTYESQAIPGVAAALALLKARGKHVRAVTNNSSLSRRMIGERLRRFGLPLDDAQIFSAAMMAARLVARSYPGAGVYVFGGAGLEAELRRAGLTTTTAPDADVVVVGHHRELSYERLTRAMRAVLGGARFVAVNVDRHHMGDDGLLPGCRAFVAALEQATGRGPDLVVGKPDPALLQAAVASVGHPASACLFVSNSLEADVGAARSVGLGSVLVLTGVTTRDDLRCTALTPDHVLSSVAELVPSMTPASSATTSSFW